MSDEFSRIEQILQRVAQSSPGIEVPNGDDAAVLRLNGSTVLSIDTAVEGVHFQRAWLTLDALGYRATTAALSDLAAMGADACAMLTSLIAPTELTDGDLYAIADGCARAARQYGAPVIGGNMARGKELSLTTTVVGSVQGAALRRSGAKPGDVIYVTGTLGAAAIGLRCLQRDLSESRHEPFVARWRSPVARIVEGQALRTIASAAIDVSDGLLQDLGHLCRSSKVGAQLDVERLPLMDTATVAAMELGESAWDLALAGGEDYELLFTAPPRVSIPFAATAIGEITETTAIILREQGVVRAAPSQLGFRHFE